VRRPSPPSLPSPLPRRRAAARCGRPGTTRRCQSTASGRTAARPRGGRRLATVGAPPSSWAAGGEEGKFGVVGAAAGDMAQLAAREERPGGGGWLAEGALDALDESERVFLVGAGLKRQRHRKGYSVQARGGARAPVALLNRAPTSRLICRPIAGHPATLTPAEPALFQKPSTRTNAFFPF